MKHIYDITWIQLIVVWIFGIVLCVAYLSPAFDYGRQWAVFLVFFVPALLIFYTIGWFQKRKKR